MKKILLILFLVSASYLNLKAQVLVRSTTLSAGFQVSQPRGEFKDQIDKMPIGFNASFSNPFLGLPIEYGLGFAWNSIASESEDVFIPDDLGDYLPSHLKVNGNAYTYYGHLRLRPFNGAFRPYGELMAGFRNYSVKSKLYLLDETGARGDEPFTEVSDRSYSWVGGWAVGLQVRVVSGLFLEGRFEKLNGDQSRYINPRSVQISPDGGYSYQLSESDTDQFNFSLGLALSF